MGERLRHSPPRLEGPFGGQALILQSPRRGSRALSGRLANGLAVGQTLRAYVCDGAGGGVSLRVHSACTRIGTGWLCVGRVMRHKYIGAFSCQLQTGNKAVIKVPHLCVLISPPSCNESRFVT